VAAVLACNMVQVFRYLTHPQVDVDPDTPVPEWSLNEVGAARVAALAQSGGLRGTTRIISSAEVKALQTAEPLAAALGLRVEVMPETHENDRSATGFLPPDAFERTADAFFAKPDDSIDGWETACAAQARIVSAVKAALMQPSERDVLMVGHGGVGTLLYCALADLAIDRAHDQGPGGGGNVFTCRFDTMRPDGPWVPMESLLT